MVLSFLRIAVGAMVPFAIVVGTAPTLAAPRELATALGTISISEARTGLRAPSCNELVVEARDALDNHLIAETNPTTNDAGACRYALSVPAQTAILLRLRPLLVAGARVSNGANVTPAGSERARYSTGSVALRFTIIAPTTYFFTPNESKALPLSY